MNKICVIVIIVTMNMFTIGGERSIYLIYPDVNSGDDIIETLRTGANTFHTYFDFEKNGNPKSTSTSWFGSQRFEAYLVHLRDRILLDSKIRNDRLVLQIFEPKLSDLIWGAKVNAAKKMGKLFSKYILNNQTRGFNVVIMLKTSSDLVFVEHFIQLHSKKADFINRIGWGFINGDPYENFELLKKYTPNIWQEVMNSGPDFLFPYDNLSMALSSRNKGLVKKVVTGIEVLESTIKSRLRQVDGIITKSPEKLLNLLYLSKYREKFCLATKEDNPFKSTPSFNYPDLDS